MISAEEIRIDHDEGGFVLEVSHIAPHDDEELLRINVQSVAVSLFREVTDKIGPWLDEGPGRGRTPAEVYAKRQYGGQIDDHATTALQHVDRADEWVNRERLTDAQILHRGRIVDYNLKLAQIHALLAVAQQVNYLTSR